MSRYKRMPLDKLIVDPSYQRELNETRVARIAEDFDPALLGALEVSVRNGKAAVFDGQHRLAALNQRGAKDAPCLVHEGLTVQEEAMLFVRLQTQRRPLRPLDRFKARVTAGEEQATEIQRLSNEAGYRIGEGGGDNHVFHIGAVSALDRVYALGGPELLERTLRFISVWQGEPHSTKGALITGVGIAIQRFEDDKRWEDIGSAVESITATSLLRKAVAAMETGGGGNSRPHAVAKEIGKLVGIRGPYRKRARAA